MENNEYGDVLIIDEENFLDHFDILMSAIKNSTEYQKLADCTQMIFDRKSNKKVMNRQSHTELVAKLAFKLAQKMGFDEHDQKLAKLIGICHDLGHTAFGHNGESRIDEVLKYYGITSKEFNNAYAEQNNIPELIINEGYVETDHSFEHHAHSRRVFRKILKDNNIVIRRELLEKLEWGILCHSESRTKNEMVTNKLWTLARYSDKFYAFTDILDTMRSENYIPGDVLHRIKTEEELNKKNGENKKSYFSDKNSKDESGFQLSQDDFDEFSGVLELFDQNGLDYFINKYVGEAKIVEEDEYFYIDTETKIGRQMRVLQGVMKYMRKKGFVGKEEELSDAMIDEIIAYRIANPKVNGNDQQQNVIDACLFVSMSTDTELRDFYKVISHDEKWIEYFDEKMANNREFETEIQREDREYIRKNPDMILNYYFNTEIEKVEEDSVKLKLYDRLIEYRKKPTLRGRRKLIELIEIAQAGGDPFSRER